MTGSRAFYFTVSSATTIVILVRHSGLPFGVYNKLILFLLLFVIFDGKSSKNKVYPDRSIVSKYKYCYCVLFFFFFLLFSFYGRHGEWKTDRRKSIVSIFHRWSRSMIIVKISYGLFRADGRLLDGRPTNDRRARLYFCIRPPRRFRSSVNGASTFEKTSKIMCTRCVRKKNENFQFRVLGKSVFLLLCW